MVIDDQAKSTAEKYAGGFKRFVNGLKNIVKFRVFYHVQ